MILYILACLISYIPLIALFLWLRSYVKKDEEFRKLCNSFLLRGVLCIFPVVLFSAVCNILLRLTGVHNSNPLFYQALYTFIVLALSEEIAKYVTFRKGLKKHEYPYSWLDVSALMTIVAIGFALLESIVYSLQASIPVVLIRGICLPHAGYGFITGYFHGKGEKSGQPAYRWIGFALAWFFHGLYDFSLSEELHAINDNLVIIPLLLAVMDIVLVIIQIVFTVKAKKRKEYTEPL